MKTSTDPVGSVSRRRKDHASDSAGTMRAHAAPAARGGSRPRTAHAALDALGVLFVGGIQLLQLFFIDDVEESFAHHGQLQTQAVHESAGLSRHVATPAGVLLSAYPQLVVRSHRQELPEEPH